MNKWIVWLAVSIHACWGALLLLYGEPVDQITAVAHGLRLGFSPAGLGLFYCVVSVLAAVGLLERVPWLEPAVRGMHWKPLGAFGSLAVILPQQFVLVLSALGAVQAITQSSFADGTVRPRAFIAADQCPAVFLCVLHTCAIMELHMCRIWYGCGWSGGEKKLGG